MKPLPQRCILVNRISPMLIRSRSAGAFMGSARGCVMRGDAHRCVRGRGRVPSGEFRCRTVPRIVRAAIPAFEAL